MKLNRTLISFIFLIAVFTTIIMTYEASRVNLDSRGILTRLEPGFWTIPIFSSNLLLLGIGILYHKRRLPKILYRLVIFILKFEVSKKTACIAIIAILSSYAILNLNGLQQQENFNDTASATQGAKNWQPQLSQWIIGADLKYLFLHYSIYLFGNIRIIPFLVSMSIAILTYLITTDISKKRFAGIIAMVALLQSPLFFKYASTSTYENSWILFYLLSLYLVRRWYLSPATFVMSFMSKGLTAVYFPMSLFFILRSDITNKKKIMNLFIYTVIVAYIAISFFSNSTQVSANTSFLEREFWTGFSSVESFLRFDGLLLMLLIPVTFGLFMTAGKGIKQADSIMILISGVLLTAPLLAGFTHMVNADYRIIPLVVFFAIGLGTVFSNRTSDTMLPKRIGFVSCCVFAISITLVTLVITDVIFPHLLLRYYTIFFDN